jgi:uracil phosphoribosyltransferase
MVINLSEKNSIISNWISEIRDTSVQADRMRFRRNLERIGEVAAYEISKGLEYEAKDVQTPLGTSVCRVLAKQPVLATILRAGMPLHNGMLNYFDGADNAFISAYRKHKRDGSFEISLEYISCTGSSLVKTIHFLKDEGLPKSIHVVCAIACTVGIEYVRREQPNVTIWCGDIDDELTAKGYIVPGLGDAGDLAFGTKQQS